MYSLIGGNEQERVNLLQVVKDTSKYRKKAMQHMRKLDFKDYKIQFGKVMS